MPSAVPPGSIDDRADVVITSPTDGQILEYEAASSKWKNVDNTGGSGGGDWVKISTATASNSATIEFTGIDSTYSTYKVILIDVHAATDNVAFDLRTSSNNGVSFDSTIGDYENMQRLDYSTGGTSEASVQVGIASDFSFRLVGGASFYYLGSSANEKLSGEITIHNPSNTSDWTRMRFDGQYTTMSGTPAMVRSSSTRKATSAVNAIQLYMTTGNISSGTFILYGIK